MKNPRILMGALLVCSAAACSEPTAPGTPSIPLPSPALPGDPIPSRLSPPGGDPSPSPSRLYPPGGFTEP
jgi:hypothetical protein